MDRTELDKIDRKILKALQEDAKMTLSELASHCGLSRTPVFERVRKLERNGVIRKYTALIDPEKAGLSLHAFCNVSLKEHASEYLKIFEHKILEHQEVVSAYHTAGMFDYLLEIRVSDMQAYHDFISHKLAGMENIGNVQSFFIMKEIREDEKARIPLS